MGPEHISPGTGSQRCRGHRSGPRADTATDLGSSGIVDDATRRIARTYDDVGRLETVTAYSDTAGNSPVNQVEYVYNGWDSGFDRFGRIADQLWRDYGTPEDVDRFKYGRASIGREVRAELAWPSFSYHFAKDRIRATHWSPSFRPHSRHGNPSFRPFLPTYACHLKSAGGGHQLRWWLLT